MTARPFLQALAARIEARAAQDGVSGIEHICQRIADGEVMKTIADEFGCARNTIYLYIKLGGDDWRRLFERARIESARTHAEDALSIADTVPATTADVAKAREQIGQRRWLAERFDRPTFGQRTDVNILQIGELHLDALRRRGGPDALPAPRPALGPGVDVVEAEIEPEDGPEPIISNTNDRPEPITVEDLL
jgi:AraC-like DNA-binding protein